MQPLKKRLQELKKQIEAAYWRLQLDEKLSQIQKLQTELAQPDAWNDSSAAQLKSKQLAQLQAVAQPWVELAAQIDETLELLAMNDQKLQKECGEAVEKIEKNLQSLKKELRFNGKYDSRDAILRLSSGAGGTDAQDWTEMLERMYLRWAERNNMKTSIVERSSGEEAGIKSSVIEVSGPNAYGKLRSEHGVHRLVRLSPFNSDNLRQTSFALVEILPQIDQLGEIQLDEKDLKIDVYRAGGHGGQSVNTTDSAVRVTHLPTGVVVAIQNERSQLQNKETALKMLRSKLAQLQQQQHTENITDLQAGESANWGSQIRNYVLHPYQVVKDARTKYQQTDASKVLDGDINGFIEAYLD